MKLDTYFLHIIFKYNNSIVDIFSYFSGRGTACLIDGDATSKCVIINK